MYNKSINKQPQMITSEQLAQTNEIYTYLNIIDRSKTKYVPV